MSYMRFFLSSCINKKISFSNINNFSKPNSDWQTSSLIYVFNCIFYLLMWDPQKVMKNQQKRKIVTTFKKYVHSATLNNP